MGHALAQGSSNIQGNTPLIERQHLHCLTTIRPFLFHDCNIVFGAITGFTALQGRNRGGSGQRSEHNLTHPPLPHNRGTFACFFSFPFFSLRFNRTLPITAARSVKQTNIGLIRPFFFFFFFFFFLFRRQTARIHLIPSGHTLPFLLCFLFFFFFLFTPI
ncbi:hypothetical protein ACQKWADRAFT_232977 [Trichoderma austrokoningii]